MLAFWLAVCGGCAGRSSCHSASECAPCGSCAFACRPVERQDIQPDAAAVPAQGQVLQLGSAGQLCALEEKTAQCLAASHATIANLLDQEAEVAEPSGGWCLHGGSSALASEILQLEAAEKRNVAAGDALQVFLRLVEAEGGAGNLLRRGHELDSMLADIDRIQQRGLLSPVSKPELESQRLELWRRQVELQLTIHKLNYQLLEMLGVQLAVGAHFWPETSLVATPEVPNETEAVGFALASRADLAALRLAANADGSESVMAARTLLQIAGGGLGTPPPTKHDRLRFLLHFLAARHEETARSQQLAGLLSDRERAIQGETRLAVSMVEAQVAQIGLTRRRLQVAKDHVQAMEAQLRLAEGGAFRVHKAQLDAITVEQDLLHDVVEWKLALIKLKQAQGLLALECGYDAVARSSARSTCRR